MRNGAKGTEPAKPKALRPFDLGSEFDLSDSDVAALSAISESSTWTAFELMSAGMTPFPYPNHYLLIPSFSLLSFSPITSFSLLRR